jgi:hypothetical protein
MAAKAAVRAARSSARQACVAPAELHQLLDSLSNNVLAHSALFHQEHQQQALQAEGMSVVSAAAVDQAPAVSQLQHHTSGKQQQHTSWHLNEQFHQRWCMTPTCMAPLQQQQQRSRFSDSSMHPASSREDSSKGSSTDSSSTSGPTASSDSSGNNSSTAGASAASAPADFLAAALLSMGSSSKAAQLTPAAITQQLDKHIVGQGVSDTAAAYTAT